VTSGPIEIQQILKAIGLFQAFCSNLETAIRILNRVKFRSLGKSITNKAKINDLNEIMLHVSENNRRHHKQQPIEKTQKHLNAK